MNKIDEREIAVYALIDIVELSGYNNIVLRRTLKKYEGLTNVQKNFLTEVVNGTLRNLIYIDYVINEYSKTKTEKMKPIILNTLRIGVYQIHFMDRVPSHGICNSAVNFVKKKGFQGLSGFVNGLLRNIIRNKDENLLEGLKKAEYLSIKYSYDIWIIKYWLSQFSYEVVEQICIGSNKRSGVTIAVNTLKTTKDKLKNELELKEIEVLDGILVNNALKLKNTRDISKLKSFKEGMFHVIDETSQYAVEILNPMANKKMLDMCSAPGGKTFNSSYNMDGTGEIVSCDIFDHKIELIEESIRRLGVTNIKTMILDGTELKEEFVDKFDYVLVDAPCSGLGIVSKKPDIKINKTFEDIQQLIPIQREILKNGIKYLKEDGVLVYSTCTISNKENIQNIRWILEEEDGIELVDLKEESKLANDEGVIEILPDDSKELDGFFIAKLRRK